MAKTETKPGHVRVLFTEDRTVQDGTGTIYKRGGVYELPKASAQHWYNRGVAKPADEEESASPEPVETRQLDDPKPRRQQPGGERQGPDAATTQDAEGLGAAGDNASGDEAAQKAVKHSRR